jgi:hypothetical protein
VSVLAVEEPKTAVPVPFRVVVRPILVSPPDTVQEGLVPVAALASVNSLTAEAVVVNINNSLPLASAINPPLTNLGAVKVLLLKVSVPASVANVPVVGRVTLVAPVEVKVMEFAPEVARVEPLAKVKVPVVVVIVNPLTEVAVATPIFGVTRVGEVASTMLPEPVVALPKTVTVPEVSGKVQVLVPFSVAAVNSPTLALLLKYSEFPEPPLVKAAPEVTSPTAVISPPEPVAEIVKVLVVLSVAKLTPDPATTFKVVVVVLAVMLV